MKENLTLLVKNPFAYFNLILCGCISYLFVDNKDLHNKVEKIQEQNTVDAWKQKEKSDEIILQNTMALKEIRFFLSK
jgi:hypothetical protein